MRSNEIQLTVEFGNTDAATLIPDKIREILSTNVAVNNVGTY